MKGEIILSETNEAWLTEEELDTIGEIMNITMGSAATAVSTMLEKQVSITTPRLVQDQFDNIDNTELQPALLVKIRYVEGIEGSNITMLKRRDVQIMLDLLMGNEVSLASDDFEFDEMSMSAACEVMNQMMGSASTALSEILDMPINISPPTASLAGTKEELLEVFSEFERTELVVAISFIMVIKDVLETTFSSFLPVVLVKKIVNHINGVMENEETPQTLVGEDIKNQKPQAISPQQPVAQQQEPQMQPQMQQQMQQAMAQQAMAQQVEREPMQFNTQAPQQQMQQQMPPMQMQQLYQQQMPMQQQYQQGQQQYMQGQMPMHMQMPYNNMQSEQNPYGYGQNMGYPAPPINVKTAEFPDFSKQNARATASSSSNMGLLMGVQLEVSVVIGRTKRKIKDIMEFGQGTVVELDNQTGAPAEIMVNGQLLAYGDVIVVGDNFGIRVTEIVGAKELIDSLT